MIGGSHSRTRFALVAAISCLAVVASFSASISAGAAAPATYLGPVLSTHESSTVTIGPDTGISVGLPNGRALWLFGDTPTYHFEKGKWTLKGFVPGSSGAVGPYTRGQAPTKLNEVRFGYKFSPKNAAALFTPTPADTFMPDGSGRPCTIKNGAAEAPVRWSTGAALMPDNQRVLVTYMDACVLRSHSTVEGWGFMEYNWTNNKISVRPVDVMPPTSDGAAISTAQMWGSPVVLNGQVTLFSQTCCSIGGVNTTTIPANVAALSNPASYVSTPISGLQSAPAISVTRSSGHWQLVAMAGNKGQFEIYTASTPTGPWTKQASGNLPRCQTSPKACYSFHAHPELSTASKIVVSYYLPAFGPGIASLHPYPHIPINHLVAASISV